MAEESSQNIASGTAVKKRRAKKRTKNQTDISNSAVETSATSRPGHGGGKRKTVSTVTAAESGVTFKGDRTLAKSIRFMHETIMSREAAYAVAEGDIGRVYECVKVSLDFSLKFDGLTFELADDAVYLRRIESFQICYLHTRDDLHSGI